jgi:exonuclease SbcC
LAFKRLDREEVAAALQARELARQQAEQAEQAVSLGRQLAELERRWTQGITAADLPLPPSPMASGAAGALAAARLRSQQALDELRVSERQADEAALAAKHARDALEKARATAEHARTGRDDTRKRADDLASALAQAERDLARLAAEQHEILEALAPAFELWMGWRELLLADITAFGAGCRDAVAGYQQQQKELAQLEASLRDRTPEAVRAAAQATERRALARARQQAARSIESSLTRLQAARRGLLDGDAVDRVQHRLHGAIEAAEEASQQAIAAHEASRERVATVQGQLHASEDARLRLETAVAQAAAALDEPLLALGVDLPELRRLVRVDRAQLAARQARLDALAHRIERLEAVVAERQERLAEHEAAGPPPADPAFLDLAEREARARLRDDEDALAQLRLALRTDEQEQLRAGGLRGEIEAQRARAHLWGSIGQLIGAADGKKFRVFAQSLTFDSLIALANAHLDELARRYQLMRVPGTDLDLQVVDREMADEARSTSSLSGGESFLVSLALALGLSSLGSRDARVDTLFIDEGFGSLDQESLEVALAALDALQESGRQVGVISHVPGLPERLGVHVRVQPRGAGRSVVVVGKSG